MNSTTDRKVALFLADGCEEIEALTVVDLLYRAGIPLTTVSITGTTTVVSSHKVTIIADTTIQDLPFEEYDMLVLPGGMPGTLNLEACDELIDQVKIFAAAGKQVAAICAAPSILAHLGLLEGRHATCNPGFEDHLISGCAILEHKSVVVDGNLTTSRAMGTAIPFGLAIVEHYLGKDTAKDLSANVLYE